MRSGVGALQAALRLPEPVEERKLGLGGGGFLEDACLTHFHARQFPLRDRHLHQIEPCGPRSGLSFALQIVAESIEFLAVFAGQDDGTGPKAMAERSSCEQQPFPRESWGRST